MCIRLLANIERILLEADGNGSARRQAASTLQF